ncbi:MAG: flagellar basal body-associated FliL family protein [Desulfovibrionaceae bacterium]
MTRFALAVCLMLLFFPVLGAAQTDPVARGGSAVYPGIDVNIGSPEGLRRLHVAFEAQCVDVKSAEAAVGPEVREAVLLLLRDQTVAGLATPQGKRRLKEALAATINRVIGGPRVVRVLFLQFVII